MKIYVKTQAELDAIPLDTKDDIYIGFGTKEKPAIVRGQYCYPVRVMNNDVVATYSNSKVFAYNNSKVYAHNNSIVYACDNSEVIADDNSEVYAYDKSEACAHHNSKIYAYDNSEVITYNNSEAVASVNSTVYAHENSKVCAFGDSRIYAYDNSEVCAWNDKCIVSINDKAITTSPSILCSGAELLNQCNGYVGGAKFAISNVPDEKKDSVFEEFYETNGRAFILTMRGISYYCVYDFDTMSVEFYTMSFYRAFENIADDTIIAYYLDNVLMPALVNTEFDKSAKSNII